MALFSAKIDTLDLESFSAKLEEPASKRLRVDDDRMDLLEGDAVDDETDSQCLYFELVRFDSVRFLFKLKKNDPVQSGSYVRKTRIPVRSGGLRAAILPLGRLEVSHAWSFPIKDVKRCGEPVDVLVVAEVGCWVHEGKVLTPRR